MTTSSILSVAPTGLFDHRYRPIQQLGGGFYGEVWKADDTTTGRTVALKLLDKNFTTPDMAWEEATRLTSLESPHLVRVHGAALAIDVPYIDMAIAAGGSTAVPTTPYGIDQDTAIRWTQQVARGLQLCHTRRIVHRDIKPENILLNATNDALLGDFGAAALMRANGTTDEHGDAHVRAPEAFGGQCTAVSDIYSLGATLYYFLTGRYPHSLSAYPDFNDYIAAVRSVAPDIREVAPHVSRTLARALRKALSVDPSPGQRFQSAAVFDRALSCVKAPLKRVRETTPHDPAGRCWDAPPAPGKTGRAVHICATPTTGNAVEVNVYYSKSGNRVLRHCQTTTTRQAPIRLRAAFDDLCH